MQAHHARSFEQGVHSVHVQEIGLKWLFLTQSLSVLVFVFGIELLFVFVFAFGGEQNVVFLFGLVLAEQMFLSTLLNAFHTGYAVATTQPEGPVRYRK